VIAAAFDLDERSETTDLSSLRLAAVSYAAELGYAVFPIVPRGKRPLIDGGFRMASSNPEQIATWWDRWPEANIGFSPGTADLLVLDIDGVDGEQLARDAGAYDVQTVEVLTSRGVHRYYQLPAGIVVGNSAHRQLDVRSAAGYVLLPPSQHESGHVYEWRGWTDAIAPIPPAVLQLVTERQDEPPAVAAREGMMQTLYARARGAGVSHASTVDAIDRRISAYVAKVGTRAQGDRNATAYRLAVWLLNDFGASDATAAAYVADWNDGNQPPLSDRELRIVLASAKRSHRRPAGCAHVDRRGFAA
jgi:hypothetical protein